MTEEVTAQPVVANPHGFEKTFCCRDMTLPVPAEGAFAPSFSVGHPLRLPHSVHCIQLHWPPGTRGIMSKF